MNRAIEQGLERGSRESTIEAIFDVLEVRFDADAPGQFAARIAAIADLQRLKQLHRAAVQVDNLEGFQRALDGAAE